MCKYVIQSVFRSSGFQYTFPRIPAKAFRTSGQCWIGVADWGQFCRPCTPCLLRTLPTVLFLWVLLCLLFWHVSPRIARVLTVLQIQIFSTLGRILASSVNDVSHCTSCLVLVNQSLSLTRLQQFCSHSLF